MRLAQDESKDGDHRYEVDGYTFVVAQDLQQLAGDITIDGSLIGIKIQSELNPKDNPGCCSH